MGRVTKTKSLGGKAKAKAKPVARKSAPVPSPVAVMEQDEEPQLDEEAVYEVEAITAKDVFDGEEHYEVKWVGFEESSWEPAANFVDHPAALKFEDEQKRALVPAATPKTAKTPKTPKLSESTTIRGKASSAKRASTQPLAFSFHFDSATVTNALKVKLEKMAPIAAGQLSKLQAGFQVESLLGLRKKDAMGGGEEEFRGPTMVYVRYTDSTVELVPLDIVKRCANEIVFSFLVEQLMADK